MCQDHTICRTAASVAGVASVRLGSLSLKIPCFMCCNLISYLEAK